MNQSHIDCDVLIIGASMAGGCLARQIKIKHPDMNIVVIDRKGDFDYAIGESMLEIFWDYASRDLKMGHYLDCNHLPKHGLRFFFDTPDKNLPLSQMSEMGRTWNDSIPAHQIDRHRFDRDLYEMNVEAGIQVLLNCASEDIRLDREQGHVITTSDGRTIRCKWLVDAAGLHAPLARKLDLVRPNDSHPISSRWARIRHTQLIDYLGDEAWRERMNFNSRFLSTVHFMYQGYWFWMIPLDEEVVSIGVVWHHEKASKIDIKSQDDFIAFMQEHQALSEVLGKRFEVLDYSGLKQMSRMSEQFYSTDRWFLTGMSAAFLDPLFSSGSAFLSDTNRMILDLIETDMAGEQETLRNKTIAYNEHSRWWLDNFLLHITGNYHGSYDLMRQLFEPLLMDYFGVILPASMSRQWGYEPGQDYDPATLRRMKRTMLEEGPGMLLHKITDELADFLQEREGLFSRNQGEFFDLKITRDYIKNSLMRGKTFSPQMVEKLNAEMLDLAVGLAIKRMALSTGASIDEQRLPEAVRRLVAREASLRDMFEYCRLGRHSDLPRPMYDVAPLHGQELAA